MMITNTFLKLNESSGKSIIVANITSGAANKAIYGWSAYASSKASINDYTTTVGKEQRELNTYNIILRLNPSVIDNEMKKDIRQKEKEEYNKVEKFKNYKKSNLLKDIDVVGGVLVDILTHHSDIKNGQI